MIGNFLYISDIKVGELFISDILFIFQIVLKQIFILRSWSVVSIGDCVKVLILLNFFVLTTTSYIQTYIDVYLIDLFYLLESFTTLLILFYLNFFHQTQLNLVHSFEKGFEFELLMIGQFFFLIGDLFYSEFNWSNLYYLGDYSDLFFFVGFAFFLKSVNALNSSKAYNLVKSFI